MAVLTDLNRIVSGPLIYEARRFEGVDLQPETQELLSRKAHKSDVAALNLLLLEDAYPRHLQQPRYDNPEGYILHLSAPHSRLTHYLDLIEVIDDRGEELSNYRRSTSGGQSIETSFLIEPSPEGTAHLGIRLVAQKARIFTFRVQPQHVTTNSVRVSLP